MYISHFCWVKMHTDSFLYTWGLIVLRFSEGTSVSFFSNMEKQCGSIFKGVELSIKNVGFAIV